MEEMRKCPQCNTHYQPTRSDQKYCGDTCRWNAWRQRKANKIKQNPIVLKQTRDTFEQTCNTLEKPQGCPLSTPNPQVKLQPEELRGVTQTKSQTGPPALRIESTEVKKADALPPSIRTSAQNEVSKWIEQQVETPIYQNIILQLNEMKTEAERFRSILIACDKQIEQIKNANNASLPRGAMAIGGVIGYGQSKKDVWAAFGGALIGLGTGKLIDHLFLEENRKKETEKSLAKLHQRKTQVQKVLDVQNQQIEIAKKHLSATTRYETKMVKRPELKSLLMSNLFKENQDNKEFASGKAEEKKEAQEQTQLEGNYAEGTKNISNEINPSENSIRASGKLMTSSQIRKIKYRSFPFQGRWKEFFGDPSYHFHLAVHGRPGEGKSTFCIQFADYLANTFGKVVYISAEEHFEKTIRDKIVKNNIDNTSFVLADIRSYDEIDQEIKNIYNFIFIDSLDTLRIDAVKLKQLKERYPKSAFITISQSTKDGKMRGSQEIVHDADITVKVDSGIARTTKNRFHDRKAEFKVFAAPEKQSGAMIKMSGNVI